MLSPMTTATGRLRIAVLDDYQHVALDYADWRALPDIEVTVFYNHLDGDDELVERLATFDVVVAMRERTPFTRQRLARLPNLRLLVTTGMGNAAIDMAAAREMGVVVSGTGGLLTPTAELTWGLIISLARHIPSEDRDVRDGGWQQTVGTDLHGATLGVVGLGNLGAAVAKVGGAFGMELLAWSQNLTAERATEVGAERVDKAELFRRADFVTIHLVLSDRTRGLVGRPELESMKSTAYLVNTSRGPIVDERALIDALEAGTIAGAGLDAFDHEPLPPDHAFRRLPNVVVTPHLGYVTDGTYRRFYTEIVEDIAAFAAGAPIRVLNG
jgi:phosphoglycerate dehydrogenase-like enzyme